MTGDGALGSDPDDDLPSLADSSAANSTDEECDSDDEPMPSTTAADTPFARLKAQYRAARKLHETAVAAASRPSPTSNLKIPGTHDKCEIVSVSRLNLNSEASITNITPVTVPAAGVSASSLAVPPLIELKSSTFSRKPFPFENVEVAAMLTEEVALSAGMPEDYDTDVVLLDSAASSHYLRGLDAPLSKCGGVRVDDSKVSGAEGSKMEAMGKMDCQLQILDGGILSLNNAILLPTSLRNRLVSIGQLSRDGYNLMFAGSKGMVTKDGIVVAIAERTGNNLYPLRIVNLPDASPSQGLSGEHACLTTSTGPSRDELCFLASSYYNGSNFAKNQHIRFNHSSVRKGTKLYAKLAKEFGPLFTTAPEFSCSDCLMTKVHRLPHPQRSKEARDHNDGGKAVGRISIDSFSWPYRGDNGEKVGTIMTDRRQLVPIATRTRAETPGRIITKLKQLNKAASHPLSLDISYEILKVEFGSDDINSDTPDDIDLQHIHYVKTDGAAEFMGHELTDFCEQTGIEKKASCGHTQQQNPGEPAVKLVTQGIAVLHRQLPLHSKWTYAFKYFCRVYGVMPHTGLPGEYETPFEALKQREMSFRELTKHVHPYGCLCFLHIPSALRAHTHAVDKGLPCAFMGFSETKEGFVVLTLGARIVVDGVWDLFFVEDRFPVAELHATELLQGLPAVAQEPAKRWRAVDLSWSALVNGDYSHEDPPINTMDMDADTIEEPNDAGMEHSTMTPEMPIAKPLIDQEGLADWGAMPHLESGITSAPAAVGTTTLLQIKTALTSKRYVSNRVQPQTGTPGPAAAPPRRSGRSRQPSHELLTSIANQAPRPPSPPSPITEEVMPPLSVDLDECAMLTSVQKEASAAYVPDPSALPAPESYREAMRRTDKAIWIAAMGQHIKKLRLIGEGVYKLVPRSEAANVMKSSWVFARKPRAHHEGGTVMEDSARAVAGGYSQVYGVDYTDTYAPTMPLESYKACEAKCINDEEAIREEYDFSGAYYQSFPTIAQYMEQPAGLSETPESYVFTFKQNLDVPKFIENARARFVWLFLRGMPGTKDGGHNFNSQMTSHVVSELGMVPNPADSASFYRIVGDIWVRMNSYVDDLTVVSNSQAAMDECFDVINLRFPCKRLAGINLIVGITVTKMEKSIAFDQRRLIDDVVDYTGQREGTAERAPFPSDWPGFTEEDCVTDPEARAILDDWPYPNAVGKVAYVARSTRYDVLWIVSILQRHFKNYGPAMIKALLRLVRFLHTTRSLQLTFQAGNPDDLHPLIIMVDASYASSMIDRSSHEGVVIFYKGCPIHASSKRQRNVALSTMESEFMAANEATKVGLWVSRLLAGFGMQVPAPFPVMEDNTAAIYLSRKPNLNGSKTRHMEVRWHWLQQQVLDGKAVLHHLRTHFQLADLMTKGLDHGTFKRLAEVVLGRVPVWEYGDGVLRRALDPSNALTREALLSSN